MLNLNNKLYVYHYNGVSYSDYSNVMFDYSRDNQVIEILDSHYLYIGFRKPINAVYVEMEVANTAVTSLGLEYYNGTTYASVSGLFDETSGLTRSGFIRWDREQTDQAAVEVDSQSAYWYRVQPTVSVDNTTSFNGINIVFADDQDLKREYFEITSSDFYPTGQSSHILTHESVRDDIVEGIRNDGRYKLNLGTGNFKDIEAFDLLEVEQVRQAAKYLALSKILDNASQDVTDIYMEKAKRYHGKYLEAIDKYFLSIDYDDDGIEDKQEQLSSYTARIVRQ